MSDRKKGQPSRPKKDDRNGPYKMTELVLSPRSGASPRLTGNQTGGQTPRGISVISQRYSEKISVNFFRSQEGASQKHILKLKKGYFENKKKDLHLCFSPFWSGTVYPCQMKVVQLFFLESCSNTFKYWFDNHTKSTKIFFLAS